MFNSKLKKEIQGLRVNLERMSNLYWELEDDFRRRNIETKHNRLLEFLDLEEIELPKGTCLRKKEQK